MKRNRFRFSTDTQRKEFLADRLQDRLEFRKKFSSVMAVFGVGWIISDVLFWQDGSISRLFFIVRTIAVIACFVFFVLLVKVKCIEKLIRKLSSFWYDTMCLLIWLAATFVIGGISLNKSILSFDESGRSGYFSAANIWMPLFFAFFFFKSFVIYWVHKVFFLSFFTLGFLGFRFYYAPVASSIVFEAMCALLVGIIIVLEEWSQRITFIKKTKSRETISLFESVLERIHETIVVFDPKMNLKYSNAAQDVSKFTLGSPETPLLPDSSTKSMEEVIRNIKNLRFLERKLGSGYLLAIKTMLATFNSRDLSLYDFIEQIQTNPLLYNEFSDQKVMSLEGKLSRCIEFTSLNDTGEYGSDQYFTIQLFARSFEGEKCFVIILKDISEHLAMMQERNELQSNLLSSLSHELNTPLGISQTLVENAAKDTKCSAYISHTYLEPALNYTRMLKFFINDVLDFVKMQKSDFTINSLFTCVEHCLNELSHLVASSMEKKGLTLKLNYDKSRRTIIKTDPSRLKQVVLNLLVNAIKYTMKGSITVSMRARPDNRGCTIKVSDTGIGINEKELAILRRKLDKINFSMLVNKNSTGAGIGLIIANAITKCLNPSTNHGLSIESIPEVGTTFTLEVENLGLEEVGMLDDAFDLSFEDDFVVEEESAEPLQYVLPYSQIPRTFQNVEMSPKKMAEVKSFGSCIPSYRSPVQSHRDPIQTGGECRCKKLLVVDDEVFNTVSVEMISKTCGYSADTAFNGRQALEAIEKRINNSCGPQCKIYDLIIMDCNMPIMDGYSTTQTIRKKNLDGEWKELIVVGCTAYEGSDKLEQCLKSGMDTYIRKPLDKTKFVQLLKKFHIGEEPEGKKAAFSRILDSQK
mgnify:FL=1